MSFTAAVPATRVPQGASPQTPGLYQFFPYIHTLFYDGDKYHPVPTETPVPARFPTAPTFSFPKNPPVFNNQRANNHDLNRPDRKLYHSSPLDMQQHKPAPPPIRMLSPQAPDFTPLFKLPPKELKAVPIRSPQPMQTTKNKALGIDLGGKELKGSESPLEFTFQTTAANDLNSSSSTLYSQKDAATVSESQPPNSSDFRKTDPPASKVEPKATGEVVDIAPQPSVNPVEIEKKAERVSRSGWKTALPTGDGEGRPASSPVFSFSSSTQQQKKPSTTTAPVVGETKPASAPVFSFSKFTEQQMKPARTTAPEVKTVQPTQTSDGVSKPMFATPVFSFSSSTEQQKKPSTTEETGIKPPNVPTAVNPPVADAIRSSPTSPVPVDNGSRPSTKVAPAPSNSGWMSEAPRVLPNNNWGAPTVEKPKAERTQITQPISLGGWGESHDDHPGMAELEPPTKVYPPVKTLATTKLTHEFQPTNVTNLQAPSVRSDVPPGIHEWQLLSKKSVERKTSSHGTEPELIQKPSEPPVEKLAAISITQQNEKPSEPKVEPKAEPEVHNLIWDGEADKSSSSAQNSTSHSAEHVGNEFNAKTDRPSTDNVNKKQLAKPMDTPSFENSASATAVQPEQVKSSNTTSDRDNSSSCATAMKPEQAKSSNTTSDRGAVSMWAPRESWNTETAAPRGACLIRLKVKLPEGKLAFLEFHEGDCPQAISERWCRVWRIPDIHNQSKNMAAGIIAQLEKMGRGSNGQKI